MNIKLQSFILKSKPSNKHYLHYKTISKPWMGLILSITLWSFKDTTTMSSSTNLSTTTPLSLDIRYANKVLNSILQNQSMSKLVINSSNSSITYHGSIMVKKRIKLTVSLILRIIKLQQEDLKMYSIVKRYIYMERRLWQLGKRMICLAL